MMILAMKTHHLINKYDQEQGIHREIVIHRTKPGAFLASGFMLCMLILTI